MELIKQRRAYSSQKLEALRDRLQCISEINAIPDITVYATGSYSRLEASEHSDLDLFFLHRGTRSEDKVRRLTELRMFAKIIEVASDLGFPTFSNDGEFLEVLYIGDMLKVMGGREDDSLNYFTARMLLILESRPLVNEEIFSEALDEVIEAYFRDYPDHADEFRPVFLINDIVRFWKTLCLNYENRRNKPADDIVKKRRQQIKNFKLKFSRLMTCFGTVAAVCGMKPPIEKDSILSLAKEVPLDRFLQSTDGSSGLAEVVEDYEWFLRLTALSTEELTQKFDDQGEKKQMFKRAELFGQRVYDMLEELARANNYQRFLVI